VLTQCSCDWSETVLAATGEVVNRLGVSKVDVF
jgi:hypothetical protein